MTKPLRRLLAGAALFATEFALVLVLGVLGVGGFLYISREVIDQHAVPFDEAAFAWTQQFFGRAHQQWVEGVTFLASRNFIVAASLLVMTWFLVLRRHRWYTLLVPVVALGGISLNLLLKGLYQRPRPLLPLTSATGLSFPSGHAMISACFYGLLIYLVRRHVRRHRGLRVVLQASLLLLILLIGATRVYLRVHYATDVLAGLLAGGTWLLLSIPLLQYLERWARQQFFSTTQAAEKQAT